MNWIFNYLIARVLTGTNPNSIEHQAKENKGRSKFLARHIYVYYLSLKTIHAHSRVASEKRIHAKLSQGLNWGSAG